MTNILILEDEDYTRKFIKKLVLEEPLVTKVYDTSNSDEAISLATEYKPDIVLMDIELDATDNSNGLKTAKIINAINPESKFIFITGYSKYAIDAFSVHPYDYILKPINIVKLKSTIHDLASIIKKEKNNIISKLTIKNNNEISFILFENILFLEKQDKNVLIHTKKDVYYFQQTLTELESKLSDNFVRTHKSFITNMDKAIKIIDIGNRSYEIEFADTDKVSFMSRYKFEQIKEKIIHSI
ncbi:LytR/AlgR family response regulator transcription factor [Tepidibacter aestuarii]|uniref:LytR/AlgR family response regulator transcription factor n=1 Tax=Tepidibacter aestuarii TaxID=2925782 RepID=UPI0020BF95B7|nr:LytTR family DNA-binding domain-containing protein [Tepidibacter aestuarii]CAH2213182.1 Stage 0 sporulation protein A homolog [Tepidibacter aestuarii]